MRQELNTRGGHCLLDIISRSRDVVWCDDRYLYLPAIGWRGCGCIDILQEPESGGRASAPDTPPALGRARYRHRLVYECD